ncbi:MAG: hypothetical protein ACRDTC_26745 [Pseudonocardiaceae bacterium]
MPTSSWAGAVLWAADPQSANAPLTALVMMAVLLPVAITLISWSYRHRFKPVPQQRKRFAAQFDGRPLVYFNVHQWSIDEAEARQIAQSRSYQENDPAHHSRVRWLRFVPGSTAQRGSSTCTEPA